MPMRVDKIHPALKHAAYSAATLLAGEDAAEFQKLHQRFLDEFIPVGPLEEDIVADIARLTWRKQNLATFRIAELAQKRLGQIKYEKVPDAPLLLPTFDDMDPAEREAAHRAAEQQARKELGDIY